jgi:MFS family permease
MPDRRHLRLVTRHVRRAERGCAAAWAPHRFHRVADAARTALTGRSPTVSLGNGLMSTIAGFEEYRMTLEPQALLTADDQKLGRRSLVFDSAWATVCGALFGGVVLVGYALQAGASPLAIGMLAAIPFLVQVLQLPATVLVERYGRRKRLSVLLLGTARLFILFFALLPLSSDAPVVPLLLLGKFGIAALSTIGACALNSWIHQLLAGQALGSFFSRRLAAGTAFGCVSTLAVGWLTANPPQGRIENAFAIAFACSGLAGFVSAFFIARCPEPLMELGGPAVSMRAKLAAPFRDEGFRRLLVMLGAWNFTGNFAAPFLTVYLMKQLGYPLSTVTLLWVVNQVANALTLFAWGHVSDQLSNKAVLSVALPANFVCLLALVFARVGEPLGLQFPLLVAVHAVMGVASGGIGLATGNLGLKLAPAGEGTSYLAAVGLVSAVAGGLAPLLGGAVAEWVEASQFSLNVRWVSSAAAHEFSVLRFEHLEFLFALSSLMGLYVLHALSRVREGPEVSERRVMQELLLEAQKTVDQLSSVGGLISSVFSFERLSERRLWFRRRPARAGPGAAVPLRREA